MDARSRLLGALAPLAIATVFAVALVLAACGGSDSDRPAGGSASQPAEGSDRVSGDARRRSRSSGRDSRAESPPRRGDAGAEESPRDEGGAPPPPEAGGRDPRTLSKQQFISRADAVCRSFRRQAATLYTGPTAGRRYFTRLIKLARRSTREQKALPLPVDGRRDAARYIELLEEGVTLLEELVRALKREDERRIERVSDRMESHGARTARFARSYGFKVCGSS